MTASCSTLRFDGLLIKRFPPIDDYHPKPNQWATSCKKNHSVKASPWKLHRSANGYRVAALSISTDDTAKISRKYWNKHRNKHPDGGSESKEHRIYAAVTSVTGSSILGIHGSTEFELPFETRLSMAGDLAIAREPRTYVSNNIAKREDRDFASRSPTRVRQIQE